MSFLSQFILMFPADLMCSSCMNGKQTDHRNSVKHPRVLLTFIRLIEHINKHEGVEWVTMEQMCDEFKRKNPLPSI